VTNPPDRNDPSVRQGRATYQKEAINPQTEMAARAMPLGLSHSNFWNFFGPQLVCPKKTQKVSKKDAKKNAPKASKRLQKDGPQNCPSRIRNGPSVGAYCASDLSATSQAFSKSFLSLFWIFFGRFFYGFGRGNKLAKPRENEYKSSRTMH